MATAKPAKQIALNKKQTELLTKWYDAQGELAKAKAAESAAKADMLAIFYPQGVSHSGVENWAMPGGWVLKVDGKINAKIDETQVAAAREALAALPADDDGVVYTLDNTIKYKPDFSATGFKELSPEAQKIACMAITFTPGSPAVKLEQSANAAKNPKATAAADYNPFAPAEVA